MNLHSLCLTLLILINSPNVFGQDNQEPKIERRFTPHISAEAETRDRGKFAFQRAVGANLNTNTLLSAFTYALTDRLEIGTVLLNFTQEQHIFNFNLKYNFWRRPQFLWSLGFSFADFKLDTSELEPQYQNLDLRVGIGAIQILFNYIPFNSKFKFGVNYNVINTSISGFENEESIEIANKAEFGLDVSYAFEDRPVDLTIGAGWLRQIGFSAVEEVEFGFGSSVRLYLPEMFFSSPTTGFHYSPKSGSVEFLVSSSIF